MQSLLYLSSLFYVAHSVTPQAYDGHAGFSYHLPPSLGNVPLAALPLAFAPSEKPQDVVLLEEIRNTLGLYPLYIDSKAFENLSLVFLANARANYSSPGLTDLSPLSTIETGLENSPAKVTTHHSLGTQVIELFGGSTARSVTYVTASHFGIGQYEGQLATAYGQYRDVLSFQRVL
ncbi:hypothetical protein PRZ48_014820 [Zasmidium cellare]|uniref:SnoaL-like domain-containing protein n=1 Tax=Zasmidium cellare TaxID=395010 RepID=A0ABR0DZF5_ZASCE|nr:hypothetical protein PRZ48_014820 [Zasmidium cellare]